MKNVSYIAERCTGCTACLNSCHKNAIQMKSDAIGFLYPLIDTSLCINCGKCVSVCPASEEAEGKQTRINAYYGAIADSEIVKKSSSGGAFTLMASNILSQKGLVIGAAIDYKSLDVVYSSTDSCTLDDLRRSKYVSSYPKDIFSEIEKALKVNRAVIFCGLPCHVDGLKHFLKKDYDNLITCDFICGGTASPRFFKEHIKNLEKKYKAKAIDINFRAKLYGWKEHSMKITFENGKEYKTSAFYDSFFKGYFEKTYQRDSCYRCQYRLAHSSDIIIADYWGGLNKNRCNDEGVSMVITNSPKGDAFFENVLKDNQGSFIKMDIEDSDYVFKTEQERYTKAFPRKAEFLKLYNQYGFEKTAKKVYLKGTVKAKLRKKISIIKQKIKK